MKTTTKTMVWQRVAGMVAVLVGVGAANVPGLAPAQAVRKTAVAPISVAPLRGAAPILPPPGGAEATASTKLIPLQPISSTPPAPAKTQQRVIGGINTNGYPNVGKVLAKSSLDETFLGTGTLVLPNWILTAGHMLSDNKGRNNIVEMTVEIGGVRYSANGAARHPYYGQSFQSDIGPLPYGDIALVRLTRSVPSSIKPALIQTIPGTVGQVLTIVGYGDTGTGAQGAYSSGGVKRVGAAQVQAVAPHWLLWRFDENERFSTAHGDSGGPQFNSAGAIASITTAGNGWGNGADGTGWGNIAINTRCDVYLPWMRSVVSRNSSPTAPSVVRYMAEPARAAGDVLDLLPTLPIINFDPKSLKPARPAD